ncbi:MAG: response regulator [Thermodesulfobacteriota bacterium]
MFTSVRRKFLFFHFLFLSGLILGFGGASYALLVKNLQKSQTDAIGSAALRNASHLESLLRQKGFLLQRIATDEAVGHYTRELQQKTLLELFSKFHQDFTTLTYFDAGGELGVAFPTGREDIPADIGGTPLFMEALWHPNQPVAVFGDDSGGDLTIACYRESFGNFEGIIVGTVSRRSLVEEMGGLRYSTSGFMLLVDESGKPLLAPAAAEGGPPTLTTLSLPSGLLARSRNGAPATEMIRIGAIDCVVAASRIDGRHPWLLLTALPMREFLAAPHLLRNILLAFTVIALLFGAFGTVVLASSITHPLQKLTRAATQLAKQEWPVPLSIHSRDEVGMLTGAFNRMADKLQRMITDLNNEIIERKKVEAELEDSRRRLTATLQSMAEGVVTASPDGTVLLANPAAARITGISSPVGKSLAEVLPLIDESTLTPLPLPPAGEDRSACFSPQHTEAMFAGDTTPFPISLTSSPLLTAEGESLGTVIVFRDLTVERNARRQLIEARDAAERLSRMKDEFIANISHEIRTPLNGIIGISELMLTEPMDEKGRRYLEMIRISGLRLLELINQLLDFSRMKSGRMLPLHIESFDLGQTVTASTGVFAARAEAKGLAFRVTWADDLPRRVVGDPGKLRQVLDNLLANALKFTGRGEISVTVRLLADSGSDALVGFTVKDSGIGIPKDRQQDIFQPFVQADGSTTRRFGGSGLGLAIAAELAAMQGGTINVDSAPGYGAAFTFSAALLPDADSADRLFFETNGLKRRRLLLIAGTDGPIAAIERELDEWLQDVTVLQPDAIKDPDAIAGYDLILIDGAAGDDAAATVAALRERGLTAALMLHPGDGALARHCRRLAIPAYFLKPLQPANLLRVLLPLFGTAVAQDDAKSAEPAVLPEGRILLVEDDYINRTLAAQMLTDIGMQVTCAENGRQALDELAANRYDLVLMDVQMPEMDGIETTSRIRGREKSTDRHMPIIAMTAHAMEQDRRKAIAAGMDGYLTKPIDKKTLLRTLTTHLGPQA